MPIFQDDLDPLDSTGPSDHLQSLPQAPVPEPLRLVSIEPTASILTRKASEESIRTELCDGPIPDSPRLPATPPDRGSSPAITSDRAELIERLKRGESPTWIPNRHLESLFNSGQAPLSSPRTPQRHRSSSPGLLPPASITPEKLDGAIDDEQRLQDGLSIERPRSALHSGDFTQDESPINGSPIKDRERAHNVEEFPLSRHSWIATSPPRDFSPFQFSHRIPVPTSGTDDYRSIPSSLSSSFSSSFVYKPPTSPLVQSESNEDLDLSLPLNNINITSSPMNSRRHTLTSDSSLPFVFPANRFAAPIQRHPSHRREGSLPYQAHQPRRSLTLTPSTQLLAGSPQTPAFLRSRRPSFSSDSSPLQHASMVGSYEESILRGRMSTTPSKPLDFVAQIGVLGLGQCKASLRCPPHVTLPFPAVFYSYANTAQGRMRAEDGPSPYVGQIDLENGLHNTEGGQRAKRKLHARYPERRIIEDDVAMAGGPAADESYDLEVRRGQRAKRRSGSPRAPPGGSYRIPEKGQIQIVIKNPNKTAVKLFLVPYDLAGMEPGTKTFIRQRSYSAGPIIDNIPVLEEATTADRPILRYLVHVHICCPSKGRFYLYKSIRIVFANRVPDGKEKLRNETTWPEPRFTPYKPIRVMHPPLATGSGPGAILAAEKAFRRRSSGFSFGPNVPAFDGIDGIPQTLHTAYPPEQCSPSPFSFGSRANLPVDPVPFRFPSCDRLGSDLSDSTDTATTGLRSPGTGGSQASRPTTKDGFDAQIAKYEKLSKGDVGYGGNAFAPSASQGSPGAEGLLSQRLRSLGVRGQGSLPPDGLQE